MDKYAADDWSATSPRFHRRRSWLLGLVGAVLVTLAGTVALLSQILQKEYGSPLPEPQTVWAAVVGLVGTVTLFTLYVFREHATLAMAEKRLCQLAERETALRSRLTELSILFSATVELETKLDLASMLRLGVRRSRACFEADHASILLFNPETGRLELKAVAGVAPEAPDDVSVRPRDGVVGLVYALVEPQVLESEACLQFAKDVGLSAVVTSGICVPLRFHGRPIGVMNLGQVSGSPSFRPAHAKLLSAFAEHFAAAIVKTHHYGRLMRGSERALREGQELFQEAKRLEVAGRATAGVAHDFNSLLTVIIGHARRLAKELEGDDRVCATLEEMGWAATRAGTLARELQTLAPGRTLESQLVAPNAVIASLTDMLQRTIGEKIELVIDLAPDLGHIKGDSSQIEYIIAGLVLNARDAMPKGGKITIETRNATLDMASAREHQLETSGAYSVLAVTHSGSGVDRGAVPHAFEPRSPTKDCEALAERSLSCIRSIVRQNGGQMLCYSEPGWGTCFKIYLPQAESLRGAGKRQEESGIAAGRGTGTLLLVDDEGMLRRLASTILESAGYAVLEAPTASEGIRICKEHEGPIHAVVTDIVMPEMNGPELVAELLRLRPNIKALYMSGYGEATLAQRGIIREGMHFLSKPYEPESLLARVQEVLTGSSTEVGSGGGERLAA